MSARPVVNFFQIAVLLMLLMAVALVSATLTMHFAIHGAEVEVPALKGMTVADARNQAGGLGLNLEVDNRYYSAEVAAGHILSQSPAPGTEVRREWQVRVSESLGPQKVDVPETVGKPEREAALVLQRAGLDVGATVRLPWAKAPEGMVLAQDPPPHAQGIARPSVNLLVAAPSDETPDGFVMPELIGLPVASARAVLAYVGIKVAVPQTVPMQIAPVGAADAAIRPVIRSGAVIAQSPLAGTRVEQSAMVHLTVAQ